MAWRMFEAGPEGFDGRVREAKPRDRLGRQVLSVVRACSAALAGGTGGFMQRLLLPLEEELDVYVVEHVRDFVDADFAGRAGVF